MWLFLIWMLFYIWSVALKHYVDKLGSRGSAQDFYMAFCHTKCFSLLLPFICFRQLRYLLLLSGLIRMASHLTPGSEWIHWIISMLTRTNHISTGECTLPYICAPYFSHLIVLPFFIRNHILAEACKANSSFID